jgi:hypothetical protein
MKQWISFLVVSIFYSCTQEPIPLLGKWKTNSVHYSATYQIEQNEGENELQVLILSYNDGTTTYKYEGEKPQYLCTNLHKENNNLYVDGTSGATKKEGVKHKYEIALINADSLRVTSYLLKKPLTEIWIKAQH